MGILKKVKKKFKKATHAFTKPKVFLNVATGGVYGVTKVGIKTIQTGKIGAGIGDAFATFGPAGNVLQPTVGTKTALTAEALVAGTSLAIAGPSAFSTSGFGAAVPVSQAPLYAAAPTQLLGVTESSLALTNSSGFAFTPVTDYTLAGVTASSLGEAGAAGGGILSGIGSVVLSGAKFIGGAVLVGYVSKFIAGTQQAIGDVLHGDLGGAVDDLVGGLPSVGQDPKGQGYVPSGYGGGGSYGSGAYGTQQASMLSTLLPVSVLVGIILLVVYFYRRKK